MNQYQDISPEEFINIHAWESLGNGIRCCATEHCLDEFGKSRFGDPRVLVTSLSDFSIREQEKHHPNADIGRMSHRINWHGAMTDRRQYATVQVGPCCDLKRCRIQDKYSLKIESFTMATFDEVPPGISTWWATNLDVQHERMRWLPFGLNDHGPGLGMLPSFRGRKKTGLLYVNFQDNTVERLKLKQFFKNCPWVTYRDDASLPVDQYLAEMAEHKFILSPFGNGLDCYRNYEAMYLGSIPILSDSVFSAHMGGVGLPMIGVDNYFGMSPTFLLQVWDQLKWDEFNWDAMRLSWWKNRILETLP